MKDVRVYAAAVQNAIFKELGLQVTNNKKNATNIVEWKKSSKVRECYNRLYSNDENAIENIARYAFPNISEKEELFDDIYIYTVAVCDIILNPEYPDMKCAKKPLERRLQGFKVFIFF